MTRYLISFDAGAMDHIREEEMPAVGKAAHAVVQEAVNAGVWVFGAGLESQRAGVVATDGTVTDGPYPETKEVIGGFSLVDVPSREVALAWAAKIAVACRCAQEVRQLLPDTNGTRCTARLTGEGSTQRAAGFALVQMTARHRFPRLRSASLAATGCAGLGCARTDGRERKRSDSAGRCSETISTSAPWTPDTAQIAQSHGQTKSRRSGYLGQRRKAWPKRACLDTANGTSGDLAHQLRCDATLDASHATTPAPFILVVNGRKVRQPVFVIGAPHSGADLFTRALKRTPGFHFTVGQPSVLSVVIAFARTPSIQEGRGEAAATVLRDAYAQGWQVARTPA